MTPNSQLEFRRDGGLEALIASNITLYLADFDHSRLGYTQTYKLVLPHLKPHIRWCATERTRKYTKPTEAALNAFPIWFDETTKKRNHYGLLLSSGESQITVGPWMFDFWLPAVELPFSSGYLALYLPVSFLQDDPAAFLTLVREIADVLPFRSGSAGYGILFDVRGGYTTPERSAQLRAWASRYRGVDYNLLSYTSWFGAKYTRTVNWLTLLDYDFVEKLGGVKKLRQELSEETTLEEHKYGVIIQAGPMPLLGDVNRGEDMRLYERVNAVVKPLRTPDHLALPGFDVTETIDWLARFDAK